MMATNEALFCNPKDEDSVAFLRSRSCRIIKFIEDYRWLTDAYISDFFVLNHWCRVKASWRDCLNGMELEEMTNFLRHNHWQANRVWPLSLLAFRTTAHSLSLPKKPLDNFQELISNFSREANSVRESIMIHPDLQLPKSHHTTTDDEQIRDGQLFSLEHCYRRHVKPKKQHEIQSLAKVIHQLSGACDCTHVIDVGAGQGHLSRLLSFGYGLKVTTIEAAGCHAPKAEKFDGEVKRDITRGQCVSKKKKKALGWEAKKHTLCSSSDASAACPSQPHHVVAQIDADISVSSFLHRIQLVHTEESSSRSNPDPGSSVAESSTHACSHRRVAGHGQTGMAPPFVLTGLHACGDLTPTMLRVYAKCPQAVGLASVSCCYMKMDIHIAGRGNHNPGYPMSLFLSNRPGHYLSWEAREMACHFTDAYYNRLIDAATEPEGDSMAHLKIHCYRAALQEIITEKDPSLEHGSIKLTQRKAHRLSFSEYAHKALQRLGLDPGLSAQALSRAESRLALWRQVVAFYTLRLTLAGTLETLLLLDKMLFLAEQGIQSALVPIFDPSLSPRNFLLLAVKQ